MDNNNKLVVNAVRKWVQERILAPSIIDFVSAQHPSGNRAALEQAKLKKLSDYDLEISSKKLVFIHNWRIRITQFSAVAYQYDGRNEIYEQIIALPQAQPNWVLIAIDHDHPTTEEYVQVLRNVLMYDPDLQIFWSHNESRTLLTGAALTKWLNNNPHDEPELVGQICAWGINIQHAINLIKNERIASKMDINAYRLGE